MKFYVVCENYTYQFCGVFLDKAKAEARAKEVGGDVLEYDLNKDHVSDDGELMD